MTDNKREAQAERHTSAGSGTEDTDARSGPHGPPAAGPEQDTTPKEIGGRKGPEPARYGDWEKQGRCIDF